MKRVATRGYLSTYDFPERSAIGPPGGERRDLSRSLPSPRVPFSPRDTGLRASSRLAAKRRGRNLNFTN